MSQDLMSKNGRVKIRVVRKRSTDEWVATWYDKVSAPHPLKWKRSEDKSSYCELEEDAIADARCMMTHYDSYHSGGLDKYQVKWGDCPDPQNALTHQREPNIFYITITAGSLAHAVEIVEGELIEDYPEFDLIAIERTA